MKKILITGGAGSLGRAFCRLLQDENEVSVVDSSEWAVAEMKADFPHVSCQLADFADWDPTGEEDVVIHAAAYKHVNLGEKNPAAFVENNLLKTMRLYAKLRHTIGRILYISTDKAVEPISVYGATKFIAERLTREVGGQVARLGNILDSRGSVIPTWEQAIRDGRPIPITDPNMTRYAIEADDAASQVWAQFLEGRQLIIPGMGDPVRILDLMATVLRRHGYAKASDYTPGVEVIGVRAGEKTHEKLVWDSELL